MSDILYSRDGCYRKPASWESGPSSLVIEQRSTNCAISLSDGEKMARKHSDADFCLTNEDRYPFAQLSDILVRNSPEIDRLNTVYLCVFQPDVLLTQFGYGRPLGLALLENTESTKVTHLDLQPLTFFTYGQADLKETIPMMEYIRTSQTLQSLNLENLNVEEYLFYTSDGDNEDGDHGFRQSR
jgi:hypothetical protein